MLLLTALAVLSTGHLQDPDLSKKITFKLNATRSAPAMEELTKLAGFPLLTTPATANEVLVINVKDVPIGDLMKRIAKVSSAEWQPEGAGFRLVRTNVVARREAAAELSARTALIKGWIEDRVKALPDQPELTAQVAKSRIEEAMALQKEIQAAEEKRPRDREAVRRLLAKAGEIGKLAPVERLAKNILRSLDASKLAAVPSSQRRVFATSPTRMQIALGPKAYDALAIYSRERAIVSSVQQIAVAGASDDEEMSHGLSSILVSNPGEVPAKILVIAQSQEETGVGLQVSVLNATGASIDSSFLSLGIEHNDDEVQGAAERTSVKPSDHKHPAADFSNVSKAMAKVFSQAMQDNDEGGPEALPFEVPEEVRQFALAPEANDPLQLVLGDLALALGTSEAPNVVANLPDEALGEAFGLANVESFEALAEDTGVKIERDGAWTLGLPSRPSAARRQRLDRVLYGALIRKGVKAGAVRLDDQAQFLTRSGDVDRSEIIELWTYILGPAVSLEQDATTLRLYGTLTPVQRRTAASPDGLPIGSLNPQQLRLLEQIVFWETRYDEYEGGFEAAPDMAEEEGDMTGSEPTETFGAGLPRGGTIRLDAQTMQGARPVRTGAAGHMMDFMDEESLGYALAAKEFSSQTPITPDEYADVSKLNLINRTQYQISFVLSPNYRLTRSLADDVLDPKVYSIETLPQQMRAAIQKAKAEALEEFKNEGQGVAPPPIRRGPPPMSAR